MSLNVMFDHPKENYMPGEFIKGKVQCSIRVPLPEYVEVSIQLIGEKSSAETTKTTITSPSSLKTNFLNSEKTVVHLGYLNEGEYDFPFKLSLPLGIPGTFVAKDVYVKYYLKVCMYEYSYEQKMCEDTKDFKIVSSVDPDDYFSEIEQDDYYSAIDSDEIDEMENLLIETEKMSFKVLIDHPKNNCKAGEFIYGRVQCSIGVLDDIEVRLKLIGEEKCAVTKVMLESSSSQKRCFLETENTVIHLGYLNKGEYQFRFILTLPFNVPSTFEGKYGYIKYYLIARMYKQGRETYEDVKEFKVFSPIDLNETENVSMTPSRYFSESTDENMFLCTPHGPDMQVRLEKNAFVVGDIVNVAVGIRKKAKISKVEARLIMNVKSRAIPQRDKPLNDMKLVVSHKGDFHEKKAKMFLLKIPNDFDIPNFEKSRFFCQTAVLQFTAVFEDPLKLVLRIEVELILGHIPVNQQKITRNRKGKSPIEEFCIIRPIPSDAKNIRLPTNIPDSQINDHDHDHEPISTPKLCPPYPTDSPLPCQETPPYPCDNNLPYPVTNSCPYPVESKFDSSSYSEEDTKNTTSSFKANTLPYPIIDNQSDKIPLSSDKMCPYPKELQITHQIPSHLKENENSMIYPSKGSTVPYPTTNNPYPTEPQITYSLASYPKENSNTLPYSNGNICPYPIIESMKRMEHRTSTLSTSISERESLSHPAIGFSNLISRNYANATPSTVGSTPYPIDIPNLMPMPLPMENSHPVQKSIGFEQLVSDHNSSRIPVEEEFEPSAPIESPIDSTEQQEETVVEAAVSTLPNIPQDLDFIDDVPSDDILTDDIPTDNIPTDDIPTDDIPTDDIPSYAPPTYEDTLSAIKKEKKKKSKRKVLVPA